MRAVGRHVPLPLVPSFFLSRSLAQKEGREGRSLILSLQRERARERARMVDNGIHGLLALSLSRERGERDKRVPPFALPQKRQARVAPIAAQPLLSHSAEGERERKRESKEGRQWRAWPPCPLSLSLSSERERESARVVGRRVHFCLFPSFARSVALSLKRKRSKEARRPPCPTTLAPSLSFSTEAEREREGKEAAYAIVHLLALSLPL